ncbi:MAG TPA: GGDEF domain-containing protein, partial [Saprospiraceae bacterium]|nr:GGDEF domain-containing protein [Saprospiraceae bacterium]
GLILVAGVGVTDFWTGSELAFSLFYLIPIALVTWFAGKKLGFIIGIASAIAWFVADALAGQSYSQPLIRYWNTAVRLCFFVVVTLLLPALKELESEKKEARIDYLTGAANRRFFFEVAQRELDRSQRYNHPFTIAYIDLDSFKTVNDQCGHRVGDKLLCVVVNQAKKYLRKTDMIARLGGDEFMILLTEADQVASEIVVTRIQLALLDEMQRNNWPVTFSIGVLTCRHAQITTDELIRKADELMYSIKKSGKNAVVYEVYAG